MVNTEILGATQLVFFNTGTVNTPIWTKIEGQRKGDLKRPKKTVDAMHKDTFPWEKPISAYRGWSVDLDGVWITDSVTGLQAPGIRYCQYCWENDVFQSSFYRGTL